MTNLITAQDIADFVPDLDTSAFSATTMSGIISQATHQMAQFCQVEGFDLNTYTDTDRARINNNGELIVNPRVRPVVDVISMTLKRGGFSSAMTLTQNGVPLYQIPDPGHRIHLPNSYLYMTGTYLAGGSSQLMALRFANMFVTTVYVAGFAIIPDDLKYACILWTTDIIMQRINRAGAQSFSQGSLSMSFGKGTLDGDSPNLNQAKTILMQGDYVKVGSF